MFYSRHGIYCIFNLVTEKIYVGSAVDIKNRWSKHREDLNKNRHDNRHLQFSWNKYGANSFIFSVIEYHSTKLELLDRENYWMKELNVANPDVGYNICLIAESRIGLKHSEDTKLKMSLASKGKLKSEAHKQSLKGLRPSEAAKAKMSISKIGSKHSEATKLKMSLIRKGKVASEQARLNMSAAQKGKVISVNTRLAVSNANKNRIGKRYKKDWHDFPIKNPIIFEV